MRLRQQNRGPYSYPFNVCVRTTDEYLQQLNLRFAVYPLPPPIRPAPTEDLLGLRAQFLNNQSFLPSALNPTPPKPPTELLLVNEESVSVEQQIENLMEAAAEDGPGVLVMIVHAPGSPSTPLPRKRRKVGSTTSEHQESRRSRRRVPKEEEEEEEEEEEPERKRRVRGEEFPVGTPLCGVLAHAVDVERGSEGTSRKSSNRSKRQDGPFGDQDPFPRQSPLASRHGSITHATDDSATPVMSASKSQFTWGRKRQTEDTTPTTDSLDSSSRTQDGSPKDRSSEWAILGAFSTPQFARHVTVELLSVNLLRTICECVCFEDVEKYKLELASKHCPRSAFSRVFPSRASSLSGDQSPYGALSDSRLTDGDRAQRFLTIDAFDLLLSPTPFVDCLRAFQFKLHVQHTDGSVMHEDLGGTCSCRQNFRRARSAAKDPSAVNEAYTEFYMLKAGRAKDWITNLIPETPSVAVAAYFRDARF